jgi:single-strand DNA-binding protein
VERFVKKGTQLYIEGRIRTRSWDDQNGNKKYTTEIIADTLQLLGRKSDNPGSQSGGYQQQGQGYQQQGYAASQPAYQQPAYAQPQPAAKPQNIVEDMPDDDLPF